MESRPIRILFVSITARNKNKHVSLQNYLNNKNYADIY